MKTVQGWTLVHARRSQWRDKFQGVFLGERYGSWVAGRQLPGETMRDGFGPKGEWSYASYYDSPSEHEVHRAHQALTEYIRLAKEAAECWDGIFDQGAGEAIDRHWARRVPLDGVADMSAGWVHPGLTGDVQSHTYMLPAVEAKYELLKYVRNSYAVREVFRTGTERGPGSELHKAYEAAIEAAGPVRFSVAGDHFSLSYDGTYNDDDEHWRGTWTRNPHPDRRDG
ncbi:hypothetical protein ACWDBD_32070 [Streptomyces sp. NPDC001118]